MERLAITQASSRDTRRKADFAVERTSAHLHHAQYEERKKGAMMEKRSPTKVNLQGNVTHPCVHHLAWQTHRCQVHLKAEGQVVQVP